MKLITKSIAAGAFIALAATVYINCPNKIVGAFLFAIGLLAVFATHSKLFTGFVGGARTVDDALKALIILLGNAIGCLFILVFSGTAAQEIWSMKLDVPLWLLCGKAIMCGILIELCVQHKKLTILAIPAFILGGAEHSIADICYMISAHNISWEGVIVIGIVIIGNIIGAQLVNRIGGE